MNRVYRLAWCPRIHALVVVSELASIKHAQPGTAAGSARRLTALAALSLLALTPKAFAQSSGDARLADLMPLVDKYSAHAAPVAPVMSSVQMTPLATAPAPASLSPPAHRAPAHALAIASHATVQHVTGNHIAPQATVTVASKVTAPPRSTAAARISAAYGTVPTAPKQPLLIVASHAGGDVQPVVVSNQAVADRRRTAVVKQDAHEDLLDDSGDELTAGSDSNSSTTQNVANATTALNPQSLSMLPAARLDASANASLGVAAPMLGIGIQAQPVIPPPGPAPTGMIVGNGGVVGTVTQLLGPTTNSLFGTSDGYIADGSLRVANANFTQGYANVNALGLPILNLTPVGTLLTSIGGTLVGGTGINSHLTLVGGVSSGNYITNINNGASGGLLGLVLPGQAPAWASTCLNVLGLVTESCWGVNAAQDYQVLVGDGASANGSKEVVIGTGASHTLPAVDAGTAFPGAGPNDPNNPSGVPTADYEDRLGHSVVVGDDASGTANAQTIVGAEATSSAANSVALGYRSAANRGGQTNYTAYGLTAPQTSAGEVSIGAVGAERQLTNVAAGSALTDAVNVAQLEGVAADAANAVQYDSNPDGSPNFNQVTLAGAPSTDGGATGGTTISNLHQGALSATSTDAVNGAQLFATNSSITNIFDTGTKYFQANSTGAGSVATGLDSVAAGMGANALNAGDVALGSGSVTAAAHTGVTALFGGTAAGKASAVMSIGASGAERQLQNLAPGVLSAGSTDAVNGSQLFSVASGVVAVGNSVATSLGGASTFDATSGTVTADLTYGGSSYGSVQSVLDALTGGGPAQGIKYFHVNSALADGTASGSDSVAIGPLSSAAGASSMAFGNGANAAADDSLALGSGASASMANSIALGAGSTTLVGAQTGYTAYGLTAAQTSLGEINVGNRQITGVAAGSAANDAVNVAQLQAVNNQVHSMDQLAVKYDADAGGLATNTITLVGDGTNTPVRITQLAAGAESATSTDAVNGSQLWHWTQDVSNIYSNTSLYNDIQNLGGGGGGSNKYFHANSTLADSSASGANSVAVGPAAKAGGSGSVAMGNGATATADNAVAIGAGSVADRANSVSVGSAGNARQITNVAAGTAATDAVNMGQLAATVTASQQGTVHYDTHTDGSVDYNNITLGNGGGTTTIHDVSAGVADTDAVNKAQLDSGMQQVVNWASAYTDEKVQQMSNRANAGVAAAMAMGGLPQAYEPGKSMAAISGGSFRGESSLAIGVSTISEGGRWVYKLTGSTDSRGDAGFSVGAGMQW